MSKEFNIGDSVWLAICDQNQVTKECPVCYGRLRVRLELGNGDMVTLPCDYCNKGFSEPRGVVEEYEWEANSQPTSVKSKEVHEYDGKREVRYQFITGHASTEDVFSTKEEADARCVLKTAEYEKEQKRRLEHIKDQTQKTFAWNAGYHMRCAKKAKQDLEYHTAKAFHMKARADKQGKSKEPIA
jgi:hypothetical protein